MSASGQRLAAGMGRLWTSLAASGTPGADWPKFTDANDVDIIFDVKFEPESGMGATLLLGR